MIRLLKLSWSKSWFVNRLNAVLNCETVFFANVIPIVKKIVDEKRISRMPISRSESLDDTFGIVYVKDIFNLDIAANSVEIENLVKDAIYLPEYTTVLSALNILRENQASFAWVLRIIFIKY